MYTYICVHECICIIYACVYSIIYIHVSISIKEQCKKRSLILKAKCFQQKCLILNSRYIMFIFSEQNVPTTVDRCSPSWNSVFTCLPIGPGTLSTHLPWFLLMHPHLLNFLTLKPTTLSTVILFHDFSPHWFHLVSWLWMLPLPFLNL